MKDRDAKLLKALGIRVRQMRIERNLSQTDLAFKAGLEQYHISKIENGTNSASITTINAIAHSLGVSIIELLTFEKVTNK